MRVERAGSLAPAAFERAVEKAYLHIAKLLDETQAKHPVRIWNFVPDIHRPAEGNVDRYMVFNAGRFKAFSRWFGESHFASRVPSASAVGHAGEALVIHCLAASEMGLAVANPRQVAPYHYSRRYGPRPPCFARATLVRGPADGKLLLVGGTASIRGEDSVHQRSLSEQTAETFENLAWLVADAQGAKVTAGELEPWLKRYRELRVYYPQETDRDAIAARTRRAFPALDRVEYVRADLCRAELLVEIEGLAAMD